MSYRDRRPDAVNEQAVEAHALSQAFRRVFSGTEGEMVLDFIVQRMCGVDAVVQITTPESAIEMLTRKNIGLEIARRALPAASETKPTKVNV